MRSGARALAWRALQRWRTRGEFADFTLRQLFGESELEAADRAFAQELFYGVLRNLTLLDSWIALLRSSKTDEQTRDLLRLGLYQLFFLQVAEHAAVYETVQLGSGRQRPLLNAIFRTALRRRRELEEGAEQMPLHIRMSHPAFLLERWTTRWGGEATTALCRWNNEPPPIYARLNLARIDLAAFLARNPAAQTVPGHPSFARCQTVPTEAIRRGECYIQDPSTVLAVELLKPAPGEEILDACAAPGGKTTYIAELSRNQADIIAVDQDPTRLDLLRANVSRLGAANVTGKQHDWREKTTPFRPQSFDKILLDAPCSNTGVMRRRVDVRWRLAPRDFVSLPRQQLAILRAVIPLLKGGGSLVYSTCSVEWEENEAVVEQIGIEFSHLHLEETKSIPPFRDGFDGAFAALFFAR